MPRSMTGFARKEIQHSWGTLSCEIRSVNHRYLEPSFRMPDVLKSAEPLLRERLRKGISRGKVETSISLKTEVSEDAQLGLNEALAARVVELAESIESKLKDPAPINTLDVLKWPGVIKTNEVETDVLNKAAQTLFAETLEQLIEARTREGLELANAIEQRIEGIDEQVKHVKAALPQILELHRAKLRTKIDALKIDIDEDRFAQEAVYIAQKVDVAEEVDRLDAHIAETKHTLKQKGPIGRRLDFLMQEFNREANTLSSKSISSETTQHAVDIKVLIEQMREQIQNIE